MEIWIDAQLSPSIALWMSNTYSQVKAKSVRELGLRDAADQDIFMAAKQQEAVVMTKDVDFLNLLSIHGPPPQVIWITTGNTSNAKMREILQRHFNTIYELLTVGEPLVEISN